MSDNMKRLIFRESVPFSIPTEEVALLNLELAESSGKDLPFGVIVDIDAIHTGPTKNCTWYTEKLLKTSTKSWTDPYPRPVLQDHIVGGFDNGIDAKGRIIGARTEKDPEGKTLEDGTLVYVLKLAAFIPDYEDVSKIMDGRYHTVSIGMSADKVICSICGTNIVEDYCGHFRGRKYEIEAEGKKTKKVVCYWRIESGEAMEVSFVNSPADVNAQITGVRSKLGSGEKLPSLMSNLSEFYLVSGEEIIPLSDNKSAERVLALAEVWQKTSKSSSTKENDLEKDAKLLTVEELEALSLPGVEEVKEAIENQEDINEAGTEALEEELDGKQKEETELATSETLLDALEETKTDDTGSEGNTDEAVAEEEVSETPDLQAEIVETKEKLQSSEEMVLSLTEELNEFKAKVETIEQDSKVIEEQNVRLRSAISKMLAESLADAELFTGKITAKEHEEKTVEYNEEVAKSPSDVFSRIMQIRIESLNATNKEIEKDVLSTEDERESKELSTEDILMSGFRERKAGVRIRKF